MTLYDKSLQILELPEVLALLAEEAVSEGAKDAALTLRPHTDFQSAGTETDETGAAAYMMVHKQCPSFSGVKDIRGVVRRADMGGVLNTRELLDVAELLRAASSSISYFTGDKNREPSVIDYLFESLSANKFLQNNIQAAIISEEEISDNASPQLADIRRHMRTAEEKIRQTLNKIITSQTYAKILQEPIITIRNNRYVVPVKTEHKSSIPGMVHDISSSGATQFIEPMTVVNINNELRELAAREEDEIDRILAGLSAEVAGCADKIITDYEVLTKLDFIFAKAKLSYKMNAIEPVLSEDKQIILQRARHPLLDKDKTVPVDIYLGTDFDTLIITGPNTGGKTVTLKTLGLLCVMAACGLHIPAAYGSTVPVFGAILADIGDEQSIEQSLSTFSSHMKNIIEMLDICTADSLLLFDELGAGTDPVEGAALAIAIIEQARHAKSLVAATTHYAELKGYALRESGVMNASCEFDIETLKPTYRLIIGIPGSSNAFAIASQLGLPEKIIQSAKSHVSTEDVTFEDTLRSLEETRIALEHERTEALRLLNDAREEKQRISVQNAQLEADRNKYIEVAKREAAAIIDEARDTVRSVVEEINALQKKAAKKANNRKVNDEKADLLRRLNQAQDSLNNDGIHNSAVPAGSAQESTGGAAVSVKQSCEHNIKPGDRVLLKSLGTQADVISVGDDGTAALQAGILKITADIGELSLVENQKQPQKKAQSGKSSAKLRTEAARSELDLRGMNADEAISVMEQFLDSAIMSKLSSVTVIHGKGTGVLRKAVHKELKSGRHKIKSFRLGVYGEGEDGVTIVEL